MKKWVSLLLSIVMVLSVIGCASRPQEGEEGNAENYGDRSKEITLCYYEGGYGSEWLAAVVDDYMTNVNTDLYIHLKSSTDNATAREKITGKTGTYDLYYIEVDMFDKQGALEEITDVLEMEVPGEAGVKVKD